MITEGMFRRYVALQMSGRTNMADLPVVAALVGITEDEVREIQRNYDELLEKYSAT